jgi:hypothetical protein
VIIFRTAVRNIITQYLGPSPRRNRLECCDLKIEKIGTTISISRKPAIVVPTSEKIALVRGERSFVDFNAYF